MSHSVIDDKLFLCRSSTTGSGDVMRMSLANNEDPDD